MGPSAASPQLKAALAREQALAASGAPGSRKHQACLYDLRHQQLRAEVAEVAEKRQ